MIGARIKRARGAAGMSLRALADNIGVSHAAIKKYEDGVVMPSSDILIKLSKSLNVRTEYFFRPNHAVLEKVEYRKRAALPKKRLNAITHNITDQIERRLELESLFPQPPVKTFAPVAGLPEQINSLDEIEGVADLVRKTWGLGSNPVPDLVDEFESNGIRVVMIDLHDEKKFDGLAAHINEMPIIVVGSDWPGDRQRFTLAHELGHLLLAERLNPEIREEAACNRFAGAFLFPAESVFKVLGENRSSFELMELSLLKEEYGISMMGIIYRAFDLAIISQPYFKQLMKKFRVKGWFKKEPGAQCESEKAHVFKQLLSRALAENYIGESKAAELLGMSVADFSTVWNLEKHAASVNQ
jgi:Zn-dependent peptidase ImmA (M78 family)/DNA-binding XRE family transcriptional regulator